MEGEKELEIQEKDEYQQFPGTAIIFIILFILVYCLVIMNLLVGLAVSDINQLMKTGKRDQLIAQIELISSVLNFRSTMIFQLLPQNIKQWLDR